MHEAWRRLGITNPGGASASSDPPPSGVEVNIDDDKAEDGLEIPDIYDNIPLGQRDDDNIDMKAPVGAYSTSVPGAFPKLFYGGNDEIL